MSWWTLLLRRARWSPGLGLGVVAVLALTALLVATVAVAGPAVVTASLRSRLADAPPVQRTAEITVRWDRAAPAPQEAAVRRLLRDALAPLPVDVEQVREGEPLSLAGRADRVVPWTGPDVQRHAGLTSGRWPSAGTPPPGAPVEGALQVTAAAALGVRVGDRLVPPRGAAGVPVVVVGLWTPRDGADPFWRGEPLALQGLQREGVRGPVLLDPAAADELHVDWTSRWRALPDLSAMTPALLAPLAASAGGLRGAASGLPSGGGPTPTADTGLGDLFAGLAQPVAAATGATRTLLLLLAVVAAGLCLLVGTALAQVRERDDAVLAARGAGGRGRLLAGLREGAGWGLLAAVPAAALTPVVVVVVTGPGTAEGRGPGAVLAGAVAAGAVALLLVAVVTMAGRPGRGRRGSRPGEALPLRLPTLLVVAVAAGAAGWQLRSGTGVSPDDPVLVVAVAVLLTAASVVVVVALAALTRALARAAGRGGPVAALAAWHAGRRGWQPVAAAVVVVLCAAGAVCLPVARQAARDEARAAAHRQVAPVVAVAAPAPPGTPLQAGAEQAADVTRRLAGLPGVAAVTPVLSVDAAVGSAGPIRVLALDGALLARMTAGAAPAAVPAGSAAVLGPRDTGDVLTVRALVPASLVATLGVGPGARVDAQDVAARPLRLVVAGTADALPADPFRPDGTPVVVVDRADLERAEKAEPEPPAPADREVGARAVWPLLPRTPRQWWVLPAPGADAAAVASAALAAVRPLSSPDGPPAVVSTRAAAEQRLLDEPLTAGLGRLALLGAGALVLAGAGALLLGQLASTRRRRGELAVLRAIGLSSGQARRLALAESLLVGGTSVLAGILLGTLASRWTTGQLDGLPATTGAGAAGPAVAVVAAVLVAGVLVVAAVRARAAAAGGIAAVVREQVS